MTNDTSLLMRLGRYQLRRPLGEGGNGQVFLAWQDNAAGEPLVCVVKFPLQKFAVEEEGRERFMQEARLAMRLGTHPNIVQVIDVGRHAQMPFIVMEYIDGIDLSQLLKQLRKRKRGLSEGSIYHVLGSCASGLHHAHVGATIAGEPVGVVHRDIKPGNILVTRDGAAKIADFGIGTTLEDGTSGQFVRGTYRYMSPEHLGRDVRPEMDIYALGVVAWEMIENRVYRSDCKGPQHFTAIMDGKIPPMRNTAVPAQLRSLVEACLETNPRRRPSARELLRALEQCPGYTRDPSPLQADLRVVLGTRRSSGHTRHEVSLTPELAATLAALQVLPKVDPNQVARDPDAPTMTRKRKSPPASAPPKAPSPDTDAGPTGTPRLIDWSPPTGYEPAGPTQALAPLAKTPPPNPVVAARPHPGTEPLGSHAPAGATAQPASPRPPKPRPSKRNPPEPVVHLTVWQTLRRYAWLFALVFLIGLLGGLAWFLYGSKRLSAPPATDSATTWVDPSFQETMGPVPATPTSARSGDAW